jgi:magnesium transporter
VATTILVVKSDGALVSDASLEEAGAYLRDPGARVWIDLFEPEMADYDALQEVFHFHPLAIEDCHSNIQRPKIDDYGDYIFMTFHGLNLAEGKDPLEMVELDLFLSPAFLVTVRYDRLFSIREVQDRIRKNPEILRRGPDVVLHAVIDRMVDFFFDLLQRMDETMDGIEDRLFEGPTRTVLQEILDLKRTIMALRRVAGPQREIMNQIARGDCPVVQEGTRYYYRDIHDHLLRIADSLDAYRDMIGTAMDTYMTLLSNRTNEIMKVLSIIATIMLPLSLITGFFGMNFQRFPGIDYEFGVWFVVAAMAVLAGIMLVYFRRKGWF